MKVLQGQTIQDIAIQYCGSADADFDIALLNGIGLTDDLFPGQELILPPVVNGDVAFYYSSKGLAPATVVLAQAELVDSANNSFTIANLLHPKDVITVLDGQNLIDIAIQYCGVADADFDIALLNGIGLTDDLMPGLKLKIPTVANKRIVAYYTEKALAPATRISNTEIIIPEALQGIEYWAIETEFIIS